MEKHFFEGDIIRQLAARKGVSTKEMASLLAVSGTSVNNIYRAEKVMAKTALKYLAAMKATEDDYHEMKARLRKPQEETPAVLALAKVVEQNISEKKRLYEQIDAQREAIRILEEQVQYLTKRHLN